jgi:hypothetical protein
MVPKALGRKQAGILQALPGGAHAQNDASFSLIAKGQSLLKQLNSRGTGHWLLCRNEQVQ